MISQCNRRAGQFVDRLPAFTCVEVRWDHHLLYLVGDSITGKAIHLAVHFTASKWSLLAHLATQYVDPGAAAPRSAVCR
jgi:hypothetical protein